MKDIVFFKERVARAGGADRLMLEEAKFFRSLGFRTHILTYGTDARYGPGPVFDGVYDFPIQRIKVKWYRPKILRTLVETYALRRTLRRLKPCVIIAQSARACTRLLVATALLRGCCYVAHMHETLVTLWFDARRGYAIIYRKAFRKLMGMGRAMRHKAFADFSRLSIAKRFWQEVFSVLEFCAVRIAKRRFVLSNRVKQEVKDLYGCHASLVRGALPSKIFEYRIPPDFRDRVGFRDERILLSVSRLVPEKRIDLILGAFAELCSGNAGKFAKLVLVIAGTGPEENALRLFSKQLGVKDRVRFVGYVAEDMLWGYYASAAVFLCAEPVDYDITVYEALALGCNIVLPFEMEVDQDLFKSGTIFQAELTSKDLARAIAEALDASRNSAPVSALREYTWDRYCLKIFNEIKPLLFE